MIPPVKEWKINDPAASWRGNNATPAKADVQGFNLWILACARMTVFAASCGKLNP